jgi:iron-sulfur cluster assembly accessory protein
MNSLSVTMTEEENLLQALLKRGVAKHPCAVGMRFYDVLFECDRISVAVDPASLPLVQGTTMRLEQEGLARRLRFDNPNAARHCGCGESFGT